MFTHQNGLWKSAFWVIWLKEEQSFWWYVSCVYPIYPIYISLLQTHNIGLVKSHAEFVVSMGSDGRILAQGSFSEVLSHDAKLRREFSENIKEVEKAEEELDTTDPDQVVKGDGKLIVEEESGVGHLSWAAGKFLSGTKRQRA